jgi:uncharacterized protein YjbI with pentapeptide repeats
MKSKWQSLFYFCTLFFTMAGLSYILKETAQAKNTGFETKTLWDWMDLLIVPIVLAVGAFYLNRSEKKLERESLEARAQLEREIATDLQQEAALQSYLDKISELLLKEKLLTTRKKEVRDVARTRTLSIIRILDTKRSNLVIQFLREARLIIGRNSILRNADMRQMNLQNLQLQNIDMQNANLQGANMAGAKLDDSNLRGVNFVNAKLNHASLGGANLQDSILQLTQLEGANLTEANLKGSLIQMTNFQDASLRYANLQNTEFFQTVLENANLRGANLEGARIGSDQLSKARSLENAIMPDGTKYEAETIDIHRS